MQKPMCNLPLVSAAAAIAHLPRFAIKIPLADLIRAYNAPRVPLQTPPGKGCPHTGQVSPAHLESRRLMTTEPVQDAFLREIQSDLQREKLRAIGRRYGVPIIMIVLAAVLGLTGWQFWQRQQTDRLTEVGLRYEAALTARQEWQEAAAAESFQQLAAQGDGGYAVLAALQMAHGKAGDVSPLNTLAADAQQDAMVRDAAAVLAGYRATGPVPGAVRARLEVLGGTTGPWQYLAREALALNALASGLTAEAGKALRELRDDPTLPAPTASRVTALLAALPSETPQQEKK